MYLTDGIKPVTPEQLDQLCALQRAGELPGLDWLFRKVESCLVPEFGYTYWCWWNFVGTPAIDAENGNRNGSAGTDA